MAELCQNHPTWLLGLLTLLFIIYLLIIFGLYGLKNSNPRNEQNNAGVNAELYQTVISRLKNREMKIQQAKKTDYPDIFK